MPLIEISSLRPPFGSEVGNVARELNLAVAECLGCPLARVTTTWRVMGGAYVVGAAASEVMRRDSHGPIVHLYLEDGSDETWESARAVVTRVLSRTLSVAPQNVLIARHQLAAAVPHVARGSRRAAQVRELRASSR